MSLDRRPSPSGHRHFPCKCSSSSNVSTSVLFFHSLVFTWRHAAPFRTRVSATSHPIAAASTTHSRALARRVAVSNIDDDVVPRIGLRRRHQRDHSAAAAVGEFLKRSCSLVHTLSHTSLAQLQQFVVLGSRIRINILDIASSSRNCKFWTRYRRVAAIVIMNSCVEILQD
jgi:hypothetical protein